MLTLTALITKASQGAQKMATTVTYRTNTADDRFETALVVESGGMGRLSVGSNRGQPTWPIGRFEAPLPAPLVQQLATALGGAFPGSPSQDTLIPDESFREIRAAGAGAPLVKRVGEQLATPAPFAAAEQVIGRIIEHVRKYPQIAVDVTLSGLPKQVPAGTPRYIDVTLLNVGRHPFYLAPSAVWGKKGWQGELAALRSDIPAAQLGSAHQKFVQLNAANFIGLGPAQPAGPVLLQPGIPIAARFQDAFAWPPGHYNAEAAITLQLLSETDEPLFTGSAVTAPRSIEVQPRR